MSYPKIAYLAFLLTVLKAQGAAFRITNVFDCTEKDNGNYNHPLTCTKFISCSNGYAYEMDCPANLHYNRKHADYCDYPELAGCSIGTPAPTQAPTDAPSDALVQWPTDEPTHPDSDVPTEALTDAPTTHAPTQAPTQEPTDTPTTTSSGEFSCNNLEDGNYINEANCRTFFTCSNGYKYVFDCPANLVYNEQTDQCDYLANVPECSN